MIQRKPTSYFVRRLIERKKEGLNGCSFLVNKSIVLDAGFTFDENILYEKQIKNKEKWQYGFNVPDWQAVPDIFCLIISHAHEDHFCGIFSIPFNKEYDLYITKVSYEIMEKKLKYYNLEYKRPKRIFFVDDNQSASIDNVSVRFITVLHDIPGNIGVEIGNEENKCFYFPDYSEKFWEKLNFPINENILITDFYPDLPDNIKGFCDLEKIVEFVNTNGLSVLVDYGWDWNRISLIINQLGLNKKISMSPVYYENFPKDNRIEKANEAKFDYLFICDLTDFQRMSKKGLAVISNHYLMSANPFRYIEKNCQYLNIFTGGHLPGKYLKEFLVGNKQIKVISVNYD